jgi:hypothetical protein
VALTTADRLPASTRLLYEMAEYCCSDVRTVHSLAARVRLTIAAMTASVATPSLQLQAGHERVPDLRGAAPSGVGETSDTVILGYD